jgi:hypothetical protein
MFYRAVSTERLNESQDYESFFWVNAPRKPTWAQALGSSLRRISAPVLCKDGSRRVCIVHSTAKWMERNVDSQCLASCIPWSSWGKSFATRQSIVIAHLKIQHALAFCSRFAVFDGHYDSDAPPGWRATKVRW